MKSLLLVAVAALTVGAGAETTTYTWDGTSTAYGDQVTVAYDAQGQVTEVMTSIAGGDKVVFVGGTVSFAPDAVLSTRDIGTLVFSNEVAMAGDVTLQGAGDYSAKTIEGDNTFTPGKCIGAPFQFVNFDEIRITAATITYMSGASVVKLSTELYQERRGDGWYEIQAQNYNGAWTRCIKIAMLPSADGVLVSNVYSKATTVIHENHEGEDFDNPTFKCGNSDGLWLTNVKISATPREDARHTLFAGRLSTNGKIAVANGAYCIATGEALGAKDGATCDLGVDLDSGTFEFTDCGQFTYAGQVTGHDGKLLFTSSDAEPRTSELRFEPNLTATDQTVLTGVSLASVTGMTAVVRGYRYDGVNKGEDVMKDEFRGDLRAAVFRNIGNETVARFQGSSKTFGSLLNSACIRLKQDGTNVVAKKIGAFDQWFKNIPSKTTDPWAWDAPNDGASGRQRGPEFIMALSNLVFKLARPPEAPTWDTQVTLACLDSTKAVSYVFKPGANRRLTAIVTSDTGMPQVQGEVHVYDRAIVTLAGRDFSKDGYTPTYQGHWQGQTGSNAAKIFVHEGGKMLTNQRAQNSGYGQTISIDGGKYAFRDASVGNESSSYMFLRSGFIVDCIANVEYRNGAVTEGYGPYLGAMGVSSRITVRGDKPCYCRNGFGLYSSSGYSSDPQTCTLDIADVTGDDAVDFTMEEPFWWKHYAYPRLAKIGAGTALFLKKSDIPNYPFVIKEGTLLMGMKTGLGTLGVSLEGGTLAIQAGLTNAVNGTLALKADSGIRLADDSQIVVADSSAEEWTAGAKLTITGDPKKSTVAFGVGGLTKDQLNQIRWNGKRVKLNDEGNLEQYIPGKAIFVR